MYVQQFGALLMTDSAFTQQFPARMVDKANLPVLVLTEELIYERGMSWTHLAELTEAPVSQVRRWYHGTAEASAEQTESLRVLAAFLDVIEQLAPDQEPVSWLETYLPLPAGYTIRPLDLYFEGHLKAVAALLTGPESVEQVLDGIQPGWREQRSDWETFTASDGVRSLRLREGVRKSPYDMCRLFAEGVITEQELIQDLSTRAYSPRSRTDGQDWLTVPDADSWEGVEQALNEELITSAVYEAVLDQKVSDIGASSTEDNS
jgi:hypothetical protein